MFITVIFKKTLKIPLDEVPFRIPEDRNGQFEPQIVKKYQQYMHMVQADAILLQPLKIFMDLNSCMNKLLILRIVSWKKLSAGVLNH